MYQQTQKQFGRAAEAYSQSSVFAEGEDLAWLVEQAGPGRHARALDLGTGAGHAAFALARCAGHIIGLDITPQMVAAACRNARERGIEHFQASVGNAERLPFPDETFSLVVCRYTGHHFHNPARVVQEIARVLTADGRLLVVDNTSPDDPATDRWINIVEQLRDPSHVREWSQSEWQTILSGGKPQLCRDTHLVEDAGVRRLGSPAADAARSGERTESAIRRRTAADSRDVCPRTGKFRLAHPTDGGSEVVDTATL